MVYTGMNVSGIRNLAGDDMAPIDWERVRDTLASDITQAPDTGGPNRHTPWLTTIDPDGSPHVTPVGFVQLDGVWYFTSGPRDPQVTQRRLGPALCRQRRAAPV